MSAGSVKWLQLKYWSGVNQSRSASGSTPMYCSGVIDMSPLMLVASQAGVAICSTVASMPALRR